VPRHIILALRIYRAKVISGPVPESRMIANRQDGRRRRRRRRRRSPYGLATGRI
jgi:hypothetical protein